MMDGKVWCEDRDYDPTFVDFYRNGEIIGYLHKFAEEWRLRVTDKKIGDGRWPYYTVISLPLEVSAEDAKTIALNALRLGMDTGMKP